MSTPAELRRRAALITQSATSITAAATHVDRSISHAHAGRADLGMQHELETARATLTRALKRAELQRLRLLRKADRAANLLPNEE